jgi:hypothetical protein
VSALLHEILVAVTGLALLADTIHHFSDALAPSPFRGLTTPASFSSVVNTFHRGHSLRDSNSGLRTSVSELRLVSLLVPDHARWPISAHPSLTGVRTSWSWCAI